MTGPFLTTTTAQRASFGAPAILENEPMARRHRYPIRDRLLDRIRNRIRDRRNRGDSPAQIAAYLGHWRKLIGQFGIGPDCIGLTDPERSALEWSAATAEARRRVAAEKRHAAFRAEIRPLTDDDKAAIVAEFAAQLTPEMLAEIGDDLDYEYVVEVREQISQQWREKQRQRAEKEQALMELPSLRRAGLTTGKVCEQLGVSKAELERWAADGRLPPDGRMYLCGLPSGRRWVRAWHPGTIQGTASRVEEWRKQDAVRRAYRRRGLRPS